MHVGLHACRVRVLGNCLHLALADVNGPDSELPCSLSEGMEPFLGCQDRCAGMRQ
jgi:hypothetical protein